jgi:hypothetical protein
MSPTGVKPVSSPTWETLKDLARLKIQELLQPLREEEVTALLGRRRSERRAEVDAPGGYRNGYGKPRKLSMQAGTLTLRRPRLRGLDAPFENRLLPLFAKRTRQRLLPRDWTPRPGLGVPHREPRSAVPEGPFGRNRGDPRTPSQMDRHSHRRPDQPHEQREHDEEY